MRIILYSSIKLFNFVGAQILMSVKELMIVTSTLTAITLMAPTHAPAIQDIVAMEETAVSTLLIFIE